MRDLRSRPGPAVRCMVRLDCISCKKKRPAKKAKKRKKK